VVLDGNEEIEGGTVVCTIGTTVNPMIAALKLPLSKGRLPVEPDFRVQGQESLWALGDCAAVTNAYDQQLAPPTAQVAVQEARQLVGNLIRAIHGQPTRPFQYKMRGMFASIGHRNAVGQVYGLNFSGFFAWFLWRGIYLGKMPTLARKIQIAFDWFWELFFPRDIVQLTTAQTERLGRAHFEPGQFVFRKGDPATKFYVIERGAAGVYLDEAAEPVAILAPGDHFGEQAILQASRRTASVRALEPLDVITIGHSSFADLLRNLSVLRVEMQRSVQRIKASNAFMDAAKHHPRLNQMRARDVMIHPVQTLPCTLSFHQALARAQQEGKGAYPIVDEQGRMLGICSRTDFYRAMRELKPPDTPLVEIMSRPVITAKESDSLTSVVLTFLREPIKRIMVVRDDDESFPVGVLTPFDILPIISQDRAPALAAIPAGLAPTAV
jgi:NADH dehydrogenase